MQNRSIGKELTFIARNLNRYLDIKTAHLHLSSATIPFLTYLYVNDGIHQDEMAENLHFDKSSVARAIKVLQQKGYVNKAVDPRMKRRNIITVTALGLSIKNELLRILESITERALKGFSADEIESYFKLTEMIDQNTQQMLRD